MRTIQLLASCVSLSLVACGGLLPGAPVPPAPAGPSHPPTSEAEWPRLEATAHDLITSAGTTAVGKPERIVNQGFTAEKSIAVEANTCYELALAWGFPRKASVSFSYGTSPKGEPVNGQLGGRTVMLPASSGVVKLCADHEGEATLLISALDANGAMANNELLEYALQVGKHPETKAETTARRERERADAAAGKAKVESNIAEAKAREERRRAETAQVVQSQCGPCRDAYRSCQVSRARTPRTGVTYGADTSCENEYQGCQFKFGGDEQQNGAWPCGAPDR
ncbi:MAG: hypothetical protein H6Q90_3666 [Deltaproteobacteria bacterium]|nr:hypothetical protein [Deltaproteobacteria bacterium]